jgi:hypothetical protein
MYRDSSPCPSFRLRNLCAFIPLPSPPSFLLTPFESGSFLADIRYQEFCLVYILKVCVFVEVSCFDILYTVTGRGYLRRTRGV